MPKWSSEDQEAMLPLWFYGTVDFCLLYHCSFMQTNWFISAYSSSTAFIFVSWESWSQTRQLLTAAHQFGAKWIMRDSFLSLLILVWMKSTGGNPFLPWNREGRSGLPGTKLIKSASFTFYQNYFWHMTFRVRLILSINFSWKVGLFRSVRFT